MNPPIHLLKPHTHPYRIELKCLNLFKVYHYLTDLGGLPLGVGGVGRCGCGVGRLTDFKSSNRIEIFWFIQVLLCFNWFGGSPLGGGWVQMWVWESPQISNLQTESKYLFYWLLANFRGSPHGGGDGWMGWESVRVCVWGVPHARTHAHARAHVYDILGTPRDSLNGDCHLQLKLSCLACIRINA